MCAIKLKLNEKRFNIPLSSLSVFSPIPSLGGGGSPPQFSPGSSTTGVVDLLIFCGRAMSPSEPGCVLGTGRPGAPPSLQRRCNGDTWQSPGVRYGVCKPPATENGQCAAVS